MQSVDAVSPVGLGGVSPLGCAHCVLPRDCFMLEQSRMRRSTELPLLSGKQEALSDAISRIFSERASFEFRDDDVEALRKQLRNGGLGGHVGPIPACQPRHESEESAWKAQHPCLLTHMPTFLKQAKGKRLTVFMDYDGTLTPIVRDPDRAFMSDQMRSAVRSVAELFPTAIISGRGREKVEEFVKLKELFYAGSHGMDIVGPSPTGSSTEAMSFQAAAKFEPIMDEVFASLSERTKTIPGASVEHNKFCVSVHFRNCEPDRLEEVVSAVEAVLAAHHDLKATRGRKVLEIRPEVEWNKGHALAHLLSALDLGDTSDVMPIYIGDDRTDEDAFTVLNGRQNGVGILVSSKVKPTNAVYALRDPVEVMSFLTNLVAWGRTPENGWHAAKACCGWQLNPECARAAEEFAHCSTSSPERQGSGVLRKSLSGRPPLCPTEKPRLAHSALASSVAGASPHVLPTALPTREGVGTGGEGTVLQDSKGGKGGAPTPFSGQPLWAETLSTRQRVKGSAASEDAYSTEAVEGSEKSEPVLEARVHAVAAGPERESLRSKAGQD